MANFDFTDFYIKYPGHPNFDDTQLIQDEIVRVIIQKYEMILFTNKGEVLANPDFGGDLEKLLHQTRVSAQYVEKDLNEQISIYIPELTGISYRLDVSFAPNPENYSDVMFIDFQVKEFRVNAYFA
tara:strand:+ start:43873 stop:44250 length:378 start_codon:yes stop_codon:yes gene_type:complete